MAPDLSSEIARRILLQGLRTDLGQYRDHLSALSPTGRAQERQAIDEISDAIASFHARIGEQPVDRALQRAGRAVTIIGGLSLLGSVVDGGMQAVLSVVGFVATAAGCVLLLVELSLTSQRHRQRQWVKAARIALNHRRNALYLVSTRRQP